MRTFRAARRGAGFRPSALLVAALGAGGSFACSSSDGMGENAASSGGATSVGGAQSSGGIAPASGGAGMSGSVSNSGGSSMGNGEGGGSSPNASGGNAGQGGMSASGGSPATGGMPGGVPPGDLSLVAIGANTTVGLEWPPVMGATGYRIYWSMNAGVTPSSGQAIDAARPNTVHRGLTNGTAYHYVITAMVGGSETAPSPEATATPGGDWALERFGTGRFEDILTGAPVAPVPIEKRVHVFLFAEGYTAADLPVFHDETHHGGDRRDDVDGWVDLVFGIEPYSKFTDAFIVWYLPRASNAHIGGGDTAFAAPVDTSGSPIMQTVPQNGETATRAWQALSMAPYPPKLFYSGGTGRARNHVASFLIFDPMRGRASVSGLTTTLTNPASTSQRIGAAFGVGHAHEFTHAFSQLRDEYIETSNSTPMRADPTSNVAPSNQCSTLPWAHLLAGGAINPSTQELVGAFGTPESGYHSELLCLLNGTHDNATHYSGDGLLRVEDRMCNFCRETTAFRIFERTGILPDTQTSFMTWTAMYRTPFYSRYGFKVPTVVPQTNNVRNPAQGMAFYEACMP